MLPAKRSTAAVFVSGRYVPPPHRIHERGATVSINKRRVFTADEPQRPRPARGDEAFAIDLLDRYLERASRGGRAYALEKLKRELRDWPSLQNFQIRPDAVDLRFRNGKERELLLPVVGLSRPLSARAKTKRFAQRLREAIADAAIVLIGDGYFAVAKGKTAELGRDRLLDLARAHRLPGETKILEIAGLKTLAAGLRERR
jgi:hypothetical protein